MSMGDSFFRHVLVVRNILLSVFQAFSEVEKFEKPRSHILGPSDTVSIVLLPFRERKYTSVDPKYCLKAVSVVVCISL